MDYLATFDGNLSVQETEKRCENEQFGGFKIDSIKFGTVFDNGNVLLVNNASFDMANSTAILTNLQFRELGSGEPEAVKNEMKNQGWTFICDTQIYVKNQLRRVLVFGRNN